MKKADPMDRLFSCATEQNLLKLLEWIVCNDEKSVDSVLPQPRAEIADVIYWYLLNIQERNTIEHMNENQIIAQVKTLLEKFYHHGIQQIEIYKELNPGPVRRMMVNGRMMGELNGVFMPIEDVMRRIATEEDIFIFNTLNGFWNYYLLNFKNFESAARQGIDRTLMELCYQRILPITKMTDAEKKRVLLIQNLCDVGMILANPSEQDRAMIPNYTEDYNFWTSQLSSEAERNKFAELQVQNYPTHIFASTKHSLWPSFFTSFNSNQDVLVTPWSAEGHGTGSESLRRMYLHQHDFVHGSYLTALVALDDEISKKHLFTSFAISTQAAYQVLHTVNTVFLSGREVELEQLVEETGELVSHVARRFSHLEVSSL